MSLRYRFMGQDTRPNAVGAASAHFDGWLRKRGIRENLDSPGRRVVRENTELAVLIGEDHGVAARRFTLYEERKEGRWATTLTAMTGHGESWLWVDLEWVSEDPWGRPPIVKPPGLVQALLLDGTVHLDRVPLPGSYLQLATGEDGRALAELAADSSRRAPVVVLSGDNRETPRGMRLRAEAFAKELAGIAPVYLMEDVALAAFNDQLPDGMRVYGGAARTYLPGRLLSPAAIERHRVLGAARIQADLARSASIVANPLRANVLSMRPPALYRDSARDLFTGGGASEGELLALAESLATDADAAVEQVRELRDQLDWQTYELEEALGELDKAQARIRYLSQQWNEAARASVEAMPTPDEFLAVSVSSFDDLVHEAGVRLPHVVVGDTRDGCAALDQYPQSAAWARKAWRALCALEGYVGARSEGFKGDFRAWCANPPGMVPSVPVGWVALDESDTTDQTPRYREARVFEVPESVDSTGRVYMPAHIKIVEGGRPAPRVHFHDATESAAPLIYVGYIGPHLPNGQTN